MSLVVTIVPNDKWTPPAKRADVELHFTDGELAGLLHGPVHRGACPAKSIRPIGLASHGEQLHDRGSVQFVG